MMSIEDIGITTSAEYKTYLKYLWRRASQWVPHIRRQYAVKALECYKDPTIRKVVMAYGEELEKLNRDMVRQFAGLSENPDADCYDLEPSVLNHAKEYGQTIDLLFDIDLHK